MADRIHPYDSPPSSAAKQSPENDSPPYSVAKKPPPPSGTYVIQIPKDQIYRVPPPENARRFEHLSRRKPRRSSCCRFLCCFISAVLFLAVVLAAAAGVFYLVFRPESPKYSVQSVSFAGLNLTSPASISPAVNASVRAKNPNNKIGIEYRSRSDVNIYYADVKLCDGDLPSFYQPSNNVTVFQTALTGADVELTETVRSELVAALKKKRVPLKLNIRAPVKIKVGSVKTWEITVKVNCDLTVDKLTAGAKIVSQECDYGVELW